MVEQASRIVQRIAVKVAHAHDDLDRVAHGMSGRDHVCDHEAERSPQELSLHAISCQLAVVEQLQAYHCHGLQAEHYRVGSHVPRVRQCILFPQLPEQILSRSHAVMMKDEVTLEETMKRSRC